MDTVAFVSVFSAKVPLRMWINALLFFACFCQVVENAVFFGTIGRDPYVDSFSSSSFSAP